MHSLSSVRPQSARSHYAPPNHRAARWADCPIFFLIVVLFFTNFNSQLLHLFCSNICLLYHDGTIISSVVVMTVLVYYARIINGTCTTSKQTYICRSINRVGVLQHKSHTMQKALIAYIFAWVQINCYSLPANDKHNCFSHLRSKNLYLMCQRV